MTRELTNGYRAYQKGKPLFACPPYERWMHRTLWIRGWVSAYHNRRDKTS